VIGRLLSQLKPAAAADEFNLIVAANGCTDNTVAVARSFGTRVLVLSIPVASKQAALTAAQSVAPDFPRVYVDADVEVRPQDVRALAAALREPGVLAAAPARVLNLAGRPWPVRWYYDVWTRLPEVQCGLWGRGVIAVTSPGQERIDGLPPLAADDLAASLLFTPQERRVVPGARVVIHTPRTVTGLLRCRVRSATVIAQLEGAEQAPASAARTRLSDLVAIVRAEPRLAPRVGLFLVMASLARTRARRAVARGDYSTWLRDESSRHDGRPRDVTAGGRPGEGRPSGWR